MKDLLGIVCKREKQVETESSLEAEMEELSEKKAGDKRRLFQGGARMQI